MPGIEEDYSHLTTVRPEEDLSSVDRAVAHIIVSTAAASNEAEPDAKKQVSCGDAHTAVLSSRDTLWTTGWEPNLPEPQLVPTKKEYTTE